MTDFPKKAIEMSRTASSPIESPAEQREEVGEDGVRVGAAAWLTVVVLTVFILLSFIDRSALNLVAGPVKADLHLTDTQLSLLLGTSFSIFYSIVGIPGGYLIDRFGRRKLLFGAVIAWSSMTVVCGLASSFGQLFIGRMGVGLGEAFISPAAFSIIRDTFPKRLRARALSVFYIGSACGTGAALLVVGALVGIMPVNGLHDLPVLGDARPWQAVLTMIGLVGLPLSLLIWTVREPRRRAVVVTQELPSMGAALRHLRSFGGLYVPLFLAQGFGGIATAGSSSWIPSYIIRRFPIGMHEVGITLGTIGVVGAFCGMVVSGYVLDQIGQRAGDRWLPVVGGGAVICAGACWVTAPLAPSLSTVWMLVSAASFLTPWGAIAGAATLTRVTPGPMMGKFTAIHFLIYNLLGYGVGPTAVAVISSQFSGGDNPLGHGISIGAGGAMVTGGVLLLAVARSMRPSKMSFRT
jgi:predicted MFS family arabinose efflux permease